MRLYRLHPVGDPTWEGKVEQNASTGPTYQLILARAAPAWKNRSLVLTLRGIARLCEAHIAARCGGPKYKPWAFQKNRLPALFTIGQEDSSCSTLKQSGLIPRIFRKCSIKCSKHKYTICALGMRKYTLYQWSSSPNFSIKKHIHNVSSLQAQSLTLD